MFLSNPVLRRYPSETCTLEITAQESPLSRWAERPILKQLRFQLHLQNQPTGSANPLILTGDRVQLDTLCETVALYVQGFLAETPAAELAAYPPRGETPAAFNPESSHRASLASSADGSPTLFARGQTAVWATAQPDSEGVSSPEPENGIYLRPHGLLKHELYLGSLAPDPEVSSIRLGALQLSDLSGVLESYESELAALPQMPRLAWLRTSPTWLRTAAVVVITAGVTTSMIRLLDGSRFIQTATVPEASQSSEFPQTISQTPPGSLIAPTSPLEPLPPPPPPQGALLPPVSVPPTAAFGNTNTATPNLEAIAPTPQLQVAPPATSSPQPAAPPASPSSPAATEVIPSFNLPLAAPSPAIPESSTTANSSTDALNADAGIASQQPAGQAARSSAASPPPAPQPQQRIAPLPETRSALETIPQVAEARAYFQQQWQPPENLTQILEYSLVLGQDGSIQRIVPLGQSAGDYIDRTGMPLVGEPFVSPLQTQASPVIRLVLNPDGTVQTFLENIQP